MNTEVAAVELCAAAILFGRTLQADGVSAGNGLVIDWRTVRSGETLREGGDAFDAAHLFVTLVGDVAALGCLDRDGGAGQAIPQITAYAIQANSTRIRSFRVGRFTVRIDAGDANETSMDVEHEDFTRALAMSANDFFSRLATF